MDGDWKDLFGQTVWAPYKTVDEQCLDIYELYPRKIARRMALKAIERALGLIDFRKLREAVQEYAEANQGRPTKFIPYCATWMNQRRWEDDRQSWTDWKDDGRQANPRRIAASPGKYARWDRRGQGGASAQT